MVTAIVVAGGRGKRMGKSISKQYIKIKGKEIIALTLEVFNNSRIVDEIILVVPCEDVDYCTTEIVKKYNLEKVKRIIDGGAERQESVYKGLLNCNSKTDIVIIHDGVRPFISDKIIADGVQYATRYGACTTAVPVKDTLKVVDEDGFSVSTPDRNKIRMIQTPQTFKYNLILDAHKRAILEGIIATDDTMLVESLGNKVKIIDGNYFNIKITTVEDLIYAESILDRGDIY